MKTIIAVIQILLISCILYSQDFYKGYQSQDPFDQALMLQPAFEINTGNMAQIVISELLSYKEAFKYYAYLEKGLYEIRLHENSFDLVIYDGLKQRKQIDVITFNETKSSFEDNAKNTITRFGNFVMDNREKYIDEQKLDNIILQQIKESGIEQGTDNFSQNTLNWKHRILWDKEILSNLGGGVSGRIMNRGKMKEYLRTPNNKPAELLSDLIDAVIVPHDAYGVHAKLFMLDRAWNRIVYCDKDFNPPYGQAKFKVYGSYGSGSNQFKNATGITYGTKIGNRYPLYICDYVNNRITSVEYDLGTYNIEPSTFRTVFSVTNPVDISFHEGLNKTWEQDDYLWYTTDENPRKLRCRSAYNNYSIHEITTFVYRNVTYSLKPTRLDVYSGWWNNQPVRAILAVVDENSNSIVYFRLNSEGLLESNNPVAFWVQQFPQSQKIASVKLATTAMPWYDPVASTVVTNDALGNGYIHTSRVYFRPHQPYVEEPVALLYLASYWVGFTGKANTSDTIAYPSYQHLIDVEVQDGFMDVFTMENWDDNYGIRRLKAGADILSYSLGDYCRDWNTMNLSLKTTNCVYIRFEVKGIRANNQTYNAKILRVNGTNENVFNNGSFYQGMIPSYTSYFNISLDQATVPGDLVSMYVSAKIVPGENPEILEYPNLGYTITLNPTSGYRTQCGSVGGCPFILVNTEQGLQIDNNILHRSEFTEFVNSDITDKYLLNSHPSFSVEDSTCTLLIQEFNNDYSYFDKIQVVAIDHPQGTKLGITENKDLVLYSPDFLQSPEYAYLNDSSDITDALQPDTTGIVEGDSLDYINAGVNGENVKNAKYKFLKTTLYVLDFVKRMKHESLKSAHNYGDSLAVIFDPADNDALPPTNPAVKDYAGSVTAFDTEADYSSGSILFAKRVNTSTVIVPVGKEQNIDSVSIIWNDSYSVGYLGIVPIFYDGFVEHELNIVSAYHSKSGDILSALIENDDTYGEMASDETITLQFRNATDTVPEYWIRDYVLIIDGKYTNVSGDNKLTSFVQNNTPKVFKLYQSYPNPFNPKAIIMYDIPKDILVTIKVYDILGREVKVLVNEVKNAGHYETVFDGSHFASGVYFYRIEAGDFVQSKKMVLVK